jgi:iron complex transport system permease protein
MKVILDLDELKQAGEIDAAEYEKLKRLAKRGTGSLAFSILIGFGVVAVSLGVLGLIPTPETAIAIGILLAGFGLAAQWRLTEQWTLLAQICIVVGALLFSGGVVMAANGSVASFLVVAAALMAGGIAARNGLLIAGAVLALSSCIGVRTAYFHAAYFLGIEEPTITIVLFSIVALATFLFSRTLAPAYERLALMAARVSVILVNFGFWIGSLWGDDLTQLRAMKIAGEGAMIPRLWFGVLWALLLIGFAVWGAQSNRRWVVNVAAIFLAIHFYTQWFERLGADPFSIFVAGLIALGIALGLWHFNKHHFAQAK